MTTLEQLTPRSALRLGLLATVPNPKVALLAVAALEGVRGAVSHTGQARLLATST
jgi:hypothetical protein